MTKREVVGRYRPGPSWAGLARFQPDPHAIRLYLCLFGCFQSALGSKLPVKAKQVSPSSCFCRTIVHAIFGRMHKTARRVSDYPTSITGLRK